MELDKAMKEHRKYTDIYDANDEDLGQDKVGLKQAGDERSSLRNKTNLLKDEIQNVEAKVLNLTSKLLLKEVEAGIEKEENKRLLKTIQDMKKNALNERIKNDFLRLNNRSKKEELENKPLPFILLQDLEKTSESNQNEMRATTEKSPDLIQELENKSGTAVILKKTLEKTFESSEGVIISPLEKSSEVGDEGEDDIVGKIWKIKQKQKELDDAKLALFSDISNTESVLAFKTQEKNAKNPSQMDKTRTNTGNRSKLKENTGEIGKKVAKIKQKEQELNYTKDILFSNSDKGNQTNQHKNKTIEPTLEVTNNDLDNHEEFKFKETNSMGQDNQNEKKIHIIVDVKDKGPNKS